MATNERPQVVLVKPRQRSRNTVQTSGMDRQVGIAPDLCGNQGLWMAWVSTPPGLASGVHHHGEAESGIYILRGSMRFYYGNNLEDSFTAGPGDFIYVPPMIIHMEENLSGSDPVEFVVARNATEMIVVNVADPREKDG